MTRSSLKVHAAGCALAAALAIAPLASYAQQQSVAQQQSANGVDAPPKGGESQGNSLEQRPGPALAQR
jgi:hypothetical protein